MKVGYDASGVFTIYFRKKVIKLPEVFPDDLYALGLASVSYYYDGKLHRYQFDKQVHLLDPIEIERPIKLFSYSHGCILIYANHVKIVKLLFNREPNGPIKFVGPIKTFRVDEPIVNIRTENKRYVLSSKNTDHIIRDDDVEASCVPRINPPTPTAEHNYYYIGEGESRFIYYRIDGEFYLYKHVFVTDLDELKRVTGVYLAGHKLVVNTQDCAEELFQYPPRQVKSARNI